MHGSSSKPYSGPFDNPLTLWGEGNRVFSSSCGVKYAVDGAYLNSKIWDSVQSISPTSSGVMTDRDFNFTLSEAGATIDSRVMIHEKIIGETSSLADERSWAQVFQDMQNLPIRVDIFEKTIWVFVSESEWKSSSVKHIEVTGVENCGISANVESLRIVKLEEIMLSKQIYVLDLSEVPLDKFKFGWIRDCSVLLWQKHGCKYNFD